MALLTYGLAKLGFQTGWIDDSLVGIVHHDITCQVQLYVLLTWPMATFTTNRVTVKYRLRISIRGMWIAWRSIRMAEQTYFNNRSVKLRIGFFKSG